ncbi:von Willebrand factor A domain-containing protein 8 [Perkinsus olseni]|uniref:von Willebrand factor A domain-containing protein 8 n=1 Tax=Perkinsus olseni TaxID=32597 RepID=A0A7J6PLI5_PEROL|nr:von Willebrand factor A domain-containing protein 8 [Perkinsus olseni]
MLDEASAAGVLSAKYEGSGELASLLAAYALWSVNVACPGKVLGSSLDFLPQLLSLKQTLEGCQGIPPLTLRRMLRIAGICNASPSKEVLASVAWRQLLLDLVPPVERAALPEGFGCGCNQCELKIADLAAHEVDLKISVRGNRVIIADIEGRTLERRPEDSRPELIPQVRESFVPIPAHKHFMAEIHRDLFLHGERNLLIVGPQGVGKNKVIDYYMEMLRVERYYMQLHRDSTVGSLTCTPTLQEGAIVWKESPLVMAAVEGRWIVLDEADKAPLEVVVLLKSLIEDGYLNLPDGRCLGGSSGIPIHPDFKCIVLCNRPGFPFLGNDFFRECGDIFSVFLLENPDVNSELILVNSVAPEVPKGVLSRLVSVFDDLRKLTTDGILSYPFSTRELLASARHMNRFGRPDEALQGVLAFERWDNMAVAHIRKVLERHGFPSKAILDGIIDSAAVLLQEAELLPKLRRVGALEKLRLQQITPPGPWTQVESRTIVMEPSLDCSLGSLELPRSVGAFTERAASLKLPLAEYPRREDVVDIAEVNGRIHVLCDSMADGMRLYSVGTNKWDCTSRSLGLSAARWMHTVEPRSEVFVNGRRARSRAKPQLMAVDRKVLVWHPAAGLLVEIPESNTSRGVVHRLFGPQSDLFVAVTTDNEQSNLLLIGSREIYEVQVAADPVRVRLLQRFPKALEKVTNIASRDGVIVLTTQDGRGIQLDGRGASNVVFPVAPVTYDSSNGVFQGVDPNLAYFYRIDDDSIWECPGGPTRSEFTMSSIAGRCGTILNYRVGELEIVDTVQPASVS